MTTAYMSSMLHNPARSCLHALLLLAMFSSPAVAEIEWSIKALGHLGGDQQRAADVEHLAYDMNNAGQVVGWSVGPPEERIPGVVTHPLQAFVTAPNGGEMLANLGRIEPYMEGSSQSYAINDAGQVVYWVSRLGSLPGFVTSAPPYTSTDSIGVGDGSRNSPVVDINNHGVAVAYDGFSTGFTYTIAPDNDSSNFAYGSPTPIMGGMPSGINDAGQIALHDEVNAYIWSAGDGGRMLNPAGTTATTAGINNEGQVIGTVDGLPFITAPDGGALSFLEITGTDFELTGLNDFGQIVGNYRGEDDLFHAFFTGANGQGIIELDSLDVVMNAGWSDLRLAAINNLGQMAGTGTIDGIRRPFFLAPVPEPETYAMMLAGLSVLGFMRRRKMVPH